MFFPYNGQMRTFFPKNPQNRSHNTPDNTKLISKNKMMTAKSLNLFSHAEFMEYVVNDIYGDLASVKFQQCSRRAFQLAPGNIVSER